MGRKNEIEGQINLFDMLVFPKETLEEDNEMLPVSVAQYLFPPSHILFYTADWEMKKIHFSG